MLRDIYKEILSLASNHYISEPMAVGGVPRDMYLKIPSNTDIDITTNDADSPRLGVSLASSINAGFKMFEDGHVSVYTDSGALDFSGNFISDKAVEFAREHHGMRDEGLSEVYSRDFTINTMHKNLLEDKLLDITGLAVRDLDDKIVRTIVAPEICFEDDIRRIFRSINFAARFNFEIDGLIVDYTRSNLSIISREMGRSLRDAFVTSIVAESVASNSDKTLGYIVDMGLLPLIPLTGSFKDELISRKMIAKYLDDSTNFNENI